MLLNNKNIFCLILVCALLAACSARELAPKPDHSAPALAASDEEQNVPFRVIVSQELNDGENLFVSGLLVARKAWDPSSTLVRLSTLSQGELRNEGFFFPAETLGNGEAAPQELPFALRLPAAGVTDYQLEAVWGAEAQSFLTKLRGGPVLLKVQSTTVKTCSDPGCEGQAQILTKLFNSGAGVIESAVLGLKLNLTEQPSNGEEQRLELGQLSLDPGKSKLLRLSIDKPISAAKIARLEPQLRVISYVER